MVQTALHFPCDFTCGTIYEIADWHKDDETVYTFDDGGKQVYRSFANEMAEIMNEQWQSCLLSQGNVSKDKRTMIRLVGLLQYNASRLLLLLALAVMKGIKSGANPGVLEYRAHPPPPLFPASLQTYFLKT